MNYLALPFATSRLSQGLVRTVRHTLYRNCHLQICQLTRLVKQWTGATLRSRFIIRCLARRAGIAWRGPTWLFSTWFIMRGMMRLGYAKEGTHLADQTLALIRQSGFREYHYPLTGEGMGARRFGVSTIAVECAMMAERGPDVRASVA